MPPPGEASPRLNARIAGVFYLLTFVGGVTSLALGGRLVNYGDAAATAASIRAHESLFRLGFAANLFASACYVAVTLLFYELFKPVRRSISMLAAFFSLVGCAVGAFGSLFQLAPLVVLGGAQYLGVFNVEQLQALALVLLKLGAQANNIGLVFFGCYCLLIGYLVFRSDFLPAILGVLMAIGVVYLPGTERVSHYFHAQLPSQFDALIHLDETRAVEPLERIAASERGEPPETYPTGM